MARGQGKAPSQRQLRVGEELRHALADVLGRRDMRDPVLREVPVTVTEVRASPDLRRATVYIVRLGGGDSEAVLAALARATPWLRARVARMVQLKYAPDFSFQIDATFDEAQRIETLLRDVDRGGDQAGGGNGGT
jgi:ribosome-binding factor A